MLTTINSASRGTEFVGAESQPLGSAGREVLQEDVGLVDQASDDVAALLALEVDGQRFLAAVEPHEVRAGAMDDMVVATREIAAVDALDLDDACPEIGEVTGGKRCGDRLLDRDDRHPLERKGHDALRCAWRTSPPPMIRRWISLVPSYRRISRTSR